MRILSLLALAISVVFLMSASLNGGFWDWLSTTSMVTRITGLMAVALGLVSCLVNAVGIHPSELRLRTWRNIAFLSTTVACGILIVTMAIAAIRLTAVPEWLPVSGFVSLGIGAACWGCFYLRQDQIANAR